jgi:hypothetical protein
LPVFSIPPNLKHMKKIFYVLVILVCLTAVGLGAVSWWAKQKLKPEMWVELAEDNWNCRAQVETASVNLLTKPATLKLTGVKLAPRDEEVAKPYTERSPLTEGSSLIEIPEITLDVKLEDLLNFRLYGEHLHITKPVVREQQDADGKSTLEALFQKPGSKKESASNKSKPSQQASLPPQQANQIAAQATVAPTAPQPVETIPSNASDEPTPKFVFVVHAATVTKGQLDIISGTTEIKVGDLDINLSGIDVDQKDLANHNRIDARISSQVLVTGMARIDGAMQKAQLAKLNLSGQGNVRPYQPQTGEWKPLTKLTLTLAKGSVLAGHMTIGDAAGKELRKLQEYGVDLSPVIIGGPLQEDAVVTGDFVNNLFVTRQLARFVFPEYEVAIEPKSNVNAAQDKHKIELRLSCGPTLQATLMDGVAKAGLGSSLAGTLTKALSDDQGRMTFDIESSGSLSNPKVKPKTDRVLKNLMRGDNLGDLLKGLIR